MSELDSGIEGGDGTVDPVCGARLRPDDAVASFEHEGATYFFAHIKCKMLFERDPDAYLRDVPPAATATANAAAVPAVVTTGAPRGRRWPLIAVAGSVVVAAVLAVVLLAPDAAPPGSGEAPPDPSASSLPAPLAPAAPPAPPAPTPQETKPLPTPAEKPVPKAAPADPTAAEAKASYDLGNRYLAEGKVAEAVEAFKTATAIEPRYAEAYAALGVAYKKQDNDKLAAEAFMTYLKLAPSGSEATRVRRMIRAYDEMK
jgi:YHS domain-containing protein